MWKQNQAFFQHNWKKMKISNIKTDRHCAHVLLSNFDLNISVSIFENLFFLRPYIALSSNDRTIVCNGKKQDVLGFFLS